MSEKKSESTKKKYYDPISIAHRTRQGLHLVAEHDKATMLEFMIKNSEIKPTVVIIKSKKRADKLTAYLKAQKLEVIVVHGNHRASQYAEAAEAFNTSQSSILITTDMVLQGLNLNTIQRIVSYDVPSQADNYFKSLVFVDEIGELISLVSPEEEGLFAVIEMLLKIDIPDTQVEGFIGTELASDVALTHVAKDKKKKPRHRSQKVKKESEK